MYRVDGFSCCKIVLFSTAGNCWSCLFGCFTNVRTWQLALLCKHSHLAMRAASQTFAPGSLQMARKRSLCNVGRASRRITPVDLRKSSNSVIATCDLFAASQQYISMEIQSSTEDNKRSCQQQVTLHTCRSFFTIATTQAPERACITFSQISNHIYDQLIKMLEFFSSRFMYYNLDMWPLQGNHNMFCVCDIHIFPATTTTTAEALHFSIQELAIVECSGHMQVKFCVVFLVQRKFCVFFSCENKIFCGTMCVIFFFSEFSQWNENIYEGFTY